MISVVIPAYNRAKTIRGCLESVGNQTFKPFEVIVVDDCSTDNTVEVVNSLDDPLLRCVNLSENMGAQTARNRGICEAKGEWIAFQDSDDEWLPEKLERQVAELAKVDWDPLTVLHADCWRQDTAVSSRELWSLPPLKGANVYQRLLTSPGTFFPAILTSKFALQKIGGLDEAVPSYQEWDTSIRLGKVCRFIHIQEPLFVYHRHSSETISKNKKRDIDGYQYIVDKFRDEIMLHCGTDTLNEHLTGNAIRAARYGFQSEALAILEKCQGWPLRVNLLRWMIRSNVDLDHYERLVSCYRRFGLVS